MQMLLVISGLSPLLDHESSRTSRPPKPRSLCFLSLHWGNNWSSSCWMRDHFPNMVALTPACWIATLSPCRPNLPRKLLDVSLPFGLGEVSERPWLMHHPHLLDDLEGAEQPSVQRWGLNSQPDAPTASWWVDPPAHGRSSLFGGAITIRVVPSGTPAGLSSLPVGCLGLSHRPTLLWGSFFASLTLPNRSVSLVIGFVCLLASS